MNQRENIRGKNFLESERSLLIKLCNKFKHILENKRSDFSFLKDKDNAWKQLTRQFNASFVGAAPRTTKQLQEKYKNIKKQLRKQHAEGKKYVCGTGGGPYMAFPECQDEEERELLETIMLSADGLTYKMDSDGRYGITGVAPPMLNSEETLEIQEETGDAEWNPAIAMQDSVPDDWTESSALLWRTPKHPKLAASFRSEQGMISATQSEEMEKENIAPTFQVQHKNQIIDKEEENQGKKSEENQAEPISTYANSTSRRRPVIKGKRRTVTSAGGKFEVVAERKLDLIEREMLVANTHLKQMEEEHEVKMQILQIRKENELLKNKILQQGKMIFEF